jgi:transcription elongation GreA/GreB family factor
MAPMGLSPSEQLRIDDKQRIRDDYSYVTSYVSDLRSKVNDAIVADVLSSDASADGSVQPSSIVTMWNEKSQSFHLFQIVGVEEEDLELGMLSFNSPLGSRIMGQKEGSWVDCRNATRVSGSDKSWWCIVKVEYVTPTEAHQQLLNEDADLSPADQMKMADWLLKAEQRYFNMLVERRNQYLADLVLIRERAIKAGLKTQLLAESFLAYFENLSFDERRELIESIRSEKDFALYYEQAYLDVFSSRFGREIDTLMTAPDPVKISSLVKRMDASTENELFENDSLFARLQRENTIAESEQDVAARRKALSRFSTDDDEAGGDYDAEDVEEEFVDRDDDDSDMKLLDAEDLFDSQSDAAHEARTTPKWSRSR